MSNTKSLSERLRSVGKSLGSAIAGYRDEDNKRCASALVELGTMSWDAADALDQQAAEIELMKEGRQLHDELADHLEHELAAQSALIAQAAAALADMLAWANTPEEQASPAWITGSCQRAREALAAIRAKEQP